MRPLGEVAPQRAPALVGLERLDLERRGALGLVERAQLGVLRRAARAPAARACSRRCAIASVTGSGAGHSHGQ